MADTQPYAKMADRLDPELNPTLSVKEAAEILHLSYGGLYDIIARGDFPVIRIGKRIRVPTATLRTYLQMPVRAPDAALVEEVAALRIENERLRLALDLISTVIRENGNIRKRPGHP